MPHSTVENLTSVTRKATRVEIHFEDGFKMVLSNEEARKWQDMLDDLVDLAWMNGYHFTDLAWEESGNGSGK